MAPIMDARSCTESNIGKPSASRKLPHLPSSPAPGSNTLPIVAAVNGTFTSSTDESLNDCSQLNSSSMPEIIVSALIWLKSVNSLKSPFTVSLGGVLLIAAPETLMVGVPAAVQLPKLGDTTNVAARLLAPTAMSASASTPYPFSSDRV